MTALGRAALATLVGLTLACDGGASVRAAQASDAGNAAQRTDLERARPDSIVRARPGYVVDSILSVEEEIRRFQATLGARPSNLGNGATTRAALVARFVRAIERNDTTTLRQLVVDRDEFGYLIYPTSPSVAPPYRQSPDLVWLMRSAATEKAITRLMARFGSLPLRFAGFSCPAQSERQGENTIWSACVVRRAGDDGDTISLRMFGSIIERAGRFKFLSLSNGL
jgi:hypothetical protein